MKGFGYYWRDSSLPLSYIYQFEASLSDIVEEKISTAALSIGLARKWWRLAFLAVTALFLIGSCWCFVNRYVPAFAGMNTQDLALAQLFGRWQSGQLGVRDFFDTPAGPFHSIGLLWSLAGFILNGNIWETEVQAWMACWVHAGWLLAALVVAGDWRRPRFVWPVAVAVCMVGYFQPGWAGTLNSLGVSGDWGLLLGLSGLWLWVGNRPMSWQWFAGFALLGLGGLCSGAVGLIGIGAAAAAGLGRWLQAPQSSTGRWAELIPGLAGSAVLAAGLAYGTDGLAVPSIAGVLRGLSSPFLGHVWPAVFIWAPYAWHVWKWRRSSAFRLAVDDRLVALGLFVLLLAVWAKSIEGTAVIGPYGMALAVIVNMGCAVRLATEHVQKAGDIRWAAAGWLVGWSLFVFAGNLQAGDRTDGWLEGPAAAKSEMLKRGMAIHSAVCSHQPELLLSAGSPLNHDEAMRIIDVLEPPATRDVLPPVMRPPVRPARMRGEGSVVIPDLGRESVLTNMSPFGLVPEKQGQAPRRLVLTYEYPESVRHVKVEFVVAPRQSSGLELTVRTGETSDEIWSGRNPVSRPTLIRHMFNNSSMPVTAVVDIRDGRLELEVLDASASCSGKVLIRSPREVGWLNRYAVGPMVPWCLGLAGIGLAALLYLGGVVYFRPGSMAETLGRAEVGSNGWRSAGVWVAVVACAILVLRKPDALINPQFWAEDGLIFFAGAYHDGWASVGHTYNGYFHLIPRLVAYFSSLILPVVHAPMLYDFAACAMVVLTVGTLFSRRLVLSWRERTGMALATVLVSHASGEVFLNSTNLHWYAALVLLLTVLKASPDMRYGSVKAQWMWDGMLIGVLGMTSPVIVPLLLLFLLRWRLFRDRHSVCMAVLASMVGAVQLWSIVLHLKGAEGSMMVEGGLVSRSGVWMQIINQRVVQDMFFFGFPEGWLPAWCGCVVAGLLLGFLTWGGLTLAVGRRGLFLGFCFFGLVVLAMAWTRNRADPLWLVMSGLGERYFYLPGVILAWLLVLTTQSARFGWMRHTALILLACMLTTSLLFGKFVSAPLADLGWRETAAKIERGEGASFEVHSQPTPLNVKINARSSSESVR